MTKLKLDKIEASTVVPIPAPLLQVWVEVQQHPMHLPKGVLQCMCACIPCVLLQPSVLTQSAQNISTALLCSEPCP